MHATSTLYTYHASTRSQVIHPMLPLTACSLCTIYERDTWSCTVHFLYKFRVNGHPDLEQRRRGSVYTPNFSGSWKYELVSFVYIVCCELVACCDPWMNELLTTANLSKNLIQCNLHNFLALPRTVYQIFLELSL